MVKLLYNMIRFDFPEQKGVKSLCFVFKREHENGFRLDAFEFN